MRNSSKKSSVVYIEGNVGVGKSTFLHTLKQHLDIDVLYEPSHLWQNVGGHNLLEQFFLNPKRWAYTSQSYILETRIDQMAEEVDIQKQQPMYFVERSIYSGRYCFASVAREIHWMNDMEWLLYQKMWDRKIQRLSVLPAGFIYLKTAASICFERIKQRGRFEETPITLDYLQRLEKKYDNWFLQKQGIDDTILNVPSLILDFSGDTLHDPTAQKHYIYQVKTFLEQF